MTNKMNELDIMWSPSYWTKRPLSPEEVIQSHLDLIEKASSDVPKKVPCQLDVPYGSTERQKIDIFGTDLEDAPLLIFVHGGYWQTAEITRSSYHYIAETLYQHKIKTIFVGYDLCPDVTVPEIVVQVENAIKKCLEVVRESPTSGIYMMGHSAGAHLVTFLFTTFVNSLCIEEQSLIKAVFLVSAIFNIEAIQKTVINKALKLDEETAFEMNPMKIRVYGGETFFYVFSPEYESPEFLLQSKDFNRRLTNYEIRNQFSVFKSVDHFQIIEDLSDGDRDITKRIVKIMTNQ